MNNTNLKLSLTAVALPGAAFCTTQSAQAHCDSMDGPVVNTAPEALKENNVNFVLI